MAVSRISVRNMEKAIEKKRFRRMALARRDSLLAQEREAYSEIIVKKLTTLPCYRQAEAVLTYINFRSEVDTLFLLEQSFADKKLVFAPKVSGREMEFFQIFGEKDLIEGYHGIREPKEGKSYTDWVSQCKALEKRMVLICLPGAAFDRKGHRIGYGGGFYDRYLSGLPKTVSPQITTAALAFNCQIFEEIPWELHDICPEKIITEVEII